MNIFDEVRFSIAKPQRWVPAPAALSVCSRRTCVAVDVCPEAGDCFELREHCECDAPYDYYSRPGNNKRCNVAGACTAGCTDCPCDEWTEHCYELNGGVEYGFTPFGSCTPPSPSLMGSLADQPPPSCPCGGSCKDSNSTPPRNESCCPPGKSYRFIGTDGQPGQETANPKGICLDCDTFEIIDEVCKCKNCDCALPYNNLSENCQIICCRNRDGSSPPNKASGCPECDSIRDSNGNQTTDKCNKPRVYSDDCKECKCPDELDGTKTYLSCEDTPQEACLPRCKKDQEPVVKGGKCQCGCPDDKVFIDCGPYDGGPVTTGCQKWPCKPGEKITNINENGKWSCRCAICSDAGQVDCDPRNCDCKPEFCILTCPDESKRASDCECCDDNGKELWTDPKNGKKICKTKCGNGEVRANAVVLLQNSTEKQPGDCYKCSDLKIQPGDSIKEECGGQCLPQCDWNKYRETVAKGCICAPCPDCKRDFNGCEYYLGPFNNRTEADTIDNKNCPGLRNGTMTVTKRDEKCICVCLPYGGAWDKDKQTCGPPPDSQGPFNPPGGGGGGGGGGDGGGGSSSSSNPCGYNASLVDGKCYCNYPQSQYDALQMKCICGNGYVYGPDGQTCVDPVNNPGGVDGVGDKFMPDFRPPEEPDMCLGVACPDGQECVGTVFGAMCR